MINLNAAIPTVSNQTTITGAFHDDTYVMLMCPISLPTVCTSFIIMWEQLVDSIPIPLMNDSKSGRYILSQDNKTLSVLRSNSTDRMVFRCKVIMQRCSDPKMHIPEYRAQTTLSTIKDMLTYNVHFLHAEL